ncbi:hypothetical protein [Streptomyces griseorubiginosus]|uniref:hypothetical protein n=1 Tax=Streptomyces griseorubiginosus TaxID=67304 RepID=UPI001AD729E9|nr:hypothetical protein [Streptomyces griseorubiginosus]MBO4254911.1 hypothetical protein [Streptomyces griseorubiginosus]
MLLPDSMRVENLIRFYRIPYACVRDVRVAPTGGLEIETLQGEVVRGFAFGGSFVDAFFKTSERAAVEIGGRVAPARDLSVVKESELTYGIRRCWSSDIPFGLAALFAVVGALAATR